MRTIEEVEWNFDNVPQEELAACCLWEYARESVHFAISSSHHAEFMASFRAGKRPANDPDPEWESFLDAFWNCDEGYMEFYDTIRNHGGPGTKPWQLLPKEIRERFVGEVPIHSVYDACGIARLGQLERLWESNLAKWQPIREKPGYDPDDDWMAYDTSHSQLAEPGHAGEPHGETIVAFAIDYRRFTNKQICDAFAEWVAANRPKLAPGPTLRGKKLRDQRVALDRLGMMRLLNLFTLREMPTCCPKGWKAFSGYEWYKERKRSLRTYRNLFPFLPKDDFPLSWNTCADIRKWAANAEPFAPEE